MPLSAAPKIELHVHLEGTVRPRTLLEIAARNGVALPADNEADLAGLYRFTDFEHFVELWVTTTHAIRTEARLPPDRRRVRARRPPRTARCTSRGSSRRPSG